MNIRNKYSYLSLAGVLFMTSCTDVPSKSHGPIVLGDSSTIVTESDPQKLRDLVTDLKPDIPSNTEIKDSVKTKQSALTAADSSKKTNIAATPLPSGPGLRIDFSDVSLFVPNVVAKMAGHPNLQRANGVVFTLENGSINGNTMRLTGNITKVSQRYQTAVMLKNNIITMLVEPLSTTTDWEPLKGANNQYRISGLEPQSLEYTEANPAAIRNAVTRAAHKRRLSQRKIQELVGSIHHIRSANEKPFIIVLRSVMWKIDGKDANGRNFSKQVRMDMPL